MAENMGKWASGNRKIAKSGHRVAAEMVPFPRRWHGGMVSANQEAIWGMSVNPYSDHLQMYITYLMAKNCLQPGKLKTEATVRAQKTLFAMP